MYIITQNNSVIWQLMNGIFYGYTYNVQLLYKLWIYFGI